jgi:hypothetical protein
VHLVGFTVQNILRCKVLQTSDLRCCFLLLLKCWVCVFQVAELCTKCWDLCYNLTINGSVWALKMCKNCTNKMLHLRDTAILYYLFTSQPLCNLFIFRKIMANFSLCISKHYKVNKNRDTAWNIINVGTKQRRVVSFILQLLYPWHPLHGRLHML